MNCIRLICIANICDSKSVKQICNVDEVECCIVTWSFVLLLINIVENKGKKQRESITKITSTPQK